MKLEKQLEKEMFASFRANSRIRLNDMFEQQFMEANKEDLLRLLESYANTISKIGKLLNK